MANKRITKDMRKKLLAAGIVLPNNATFADAVAYGQVIKAIRGSSSNASEIREAVEGKATQRIELSGGEDGSQTPIPIAIIQVDLSALNDKELEQYEALRRKAAGRQPRSN
jgi:hypothetical protein